MDWIKKGNDIYIKQETTEIIDLKLLKHEIENLTKEQQKSLTSISWR